MNIKQSIDFDKVVLGKDLDRGSYEQKFVWWDENKDRLSKGDSDVLLALKDLTIFAYAFFKDKTGKPLRLEPYQDAIAQVAMDYNFDPHNPNRFLLFVAANQIGKSALLAMMAIYYLINGKNENIIIVSNNLMNSQRVLREIKFLLNTSTFTNWKESIGDTDNTTMLSMLRNDGSMNRIVCAPSGEGLLGYPVTRLLLDEIDFYEEGKNFFWKVGYPRLGQTKGQCIGFSNPNPDISKANSILHELWEGDLFKRKFNFNFLDASWNTQEEYEIAKRNSPSHIFCSTHDGKWSELSGAFFTDAEIKDMMNKEWQNKLFVTDRPVYIAVDLGKMRDNTTIGVGITKKPINDIDKYLDLEIKYTEKMPLKTHYDQIAERLHQIKAWYDENCNGVAVIAFDSTGQKTFGDFLKRLNISAVGVDFSAKDSKKTLIYNNLKLMSENRKIKVVYTRDCELQLSKLEIKETDAKGLKIVKHKTEGDHDDYPDMIAIMIHVSVKPSKIPVTVCNVQRGVKEQAEDKEYVTTQDDVDKYIGEQVKKNRASHYKSKQMFNNFGGMM